MNSAADLGDTFIVLGVTALAFAQIINMRQTGPWETDWWIVISSEEATDQAGFVYIRLCFETLTRDEIVIRFRLTQDQYPD